ncbi:radical SAM protein [Agromyces aurantiacus]|uniref:Radical SAM protein n=1 Tax=Agromyces aurantiacus TaxID=165814 RepID=A0ABV9R170_9MICO|nr:radical SAM protein [Agromyces aurantiacus]MBM7506140.1 putative radical SAM superfamily Fe-S cluster-containing enzyme [Agromyces aurantiacus]
MGVQNVAGTLRNYRIHRYVNAFCPRCHEEDPERDLDTVQRLSGWLAAYDDDSVWLERGCPEHGLVRTLYDESAEVLAYLEQWTAPTKWHAPDVARNFRPVPGAYLDGLPAMQSQHTCILLEDLTDHCNLRCPTCFAESGPAATATAPLADVLASVDDRLAKEHGRLDVLMLSGGEPTLYPWLEQLVEHLVARPIVRILINSNGLRIANDDAFVEFLKLHRERVEVYLQYDGESPEASRFHRGADIRRFKERAIERLSAAGVFMTLTMTAAKGVNDDEIGAVIRRAMTTPYVGGVTIQPVFGSGRNSGIDAEDRLTHGGVLKRLEPQTNGEITWRDLTALPCSHPHCCSVGYFLLDDAKEWKSLTSIMGHDRLKGFLDLNPDLIANRIADSEVNTRMKEAVKHSLLDLFSEQSSLSHPSMSAIWRDICTNCDLGIGTLTKLATSALPGQHARLRKFLGERVLRITVKPFMDMNTMIEERLTQCCVHVATVNDDNGAHQCAPFCALQAWAPLARQRLSTASARNAADWGDDRAPVPLGEVIPVGGPE